MAHLVLIVADTLRDPTAVPGFDPARHLPFLAGEERAGRAVHLRNVVASSAWTIPSHASLLAGSEPWEAHYHSTGVRVPRAPTLGERWVERGGESAAYTANGLVSPEYGFLSEYGSLNRFARNRNLAPRVWELVRPLTALGSGASDVVGTNRSRTVSPPRSPAGNLGPRCVGSLTHRAVQFLTGGRGIVRGIDRLLRTRRTSRPLHLFVNLMEVHEPYTLSPRDASGPVPPQMFLPLMGLAPRLDLLKGCPSSRPMLSQAYLRSLRRLDDRLGELFAVLARRDLLRDATVVLVSDHGQALGEGGFFGHGHSLQDEVARIPAWVWSFRGGEKVAREAPTPPDTFDLRHLHDGLLRLADGTGALDELYRGIEDARARRGPALSYWEGPDLVDVGTDRPEDQRQPVVRRLRLLAGPADLTLEKGLVEQGGHVRLEARGPGSATDPLEQQARRLLDLSAAGEGSGPARGESVERRLRSWGYA